MVSNQEDTDETQPSEGSLQVGDRVREEERKELASLDKAVAPDTEMDEKVQWRRFLFFPRPFFFWSLATSNHECHINRLSVYQWPGGARIRDLKKGKSTA